MASSRHEIRQQRMYQELLPAIDAVPAGALATINVQVNVAIETASRALPSIARFAKIATKLPRFDASCFENLEPYTIALAHVQGLYERDRSAAKRSPKPKRAAALQARDVLIVDVRSLMNHGFITPIVLRRSPSLRGLASDIARLCGLVRKSWARCSGKTALTLKRLAAFEEVGEALLAKSDDRHGGAIRARRQRTFTLFVTAYNEIRSAIMFLRRREGDADEIIPSLYAGRGGRGPREAR